MKRLLARLSGWSRIPQYITTSLPLFLIIIIFIVPFVYPAQPEWKPEKYVTIVVRVGPGGGHDKQARVLQKIMESKKLVNTSIVIENKEGGSGAVAWSYLNKQHAGDAHYIATLSQQLLFIDITRGTLKYTDFTPIAMLDADYVGYAVKPDSPIKSGKDLIDRLKKDPKAISFGLGSLGGANHNTTILVMDQAGIDVKKLKMVILGGSADATTALLGGHVDVLITTTSNSAELLEAGQIRLIAISSPQRLGGVYAKVPTWKEQGSDVVFSNWRGIIGPKGLNQAHIAYWDNVFAKVTNTDEWKKYLKDTLGENFYLNSKEAKKYMDDEYTKVKSLYNRLGIANLGLTK
jgi:putative tricarboxylic transport membrane protein